MRKCSSLKLGLFNLFLPCSNPGDYHFPYKYDVTYN